MRSEIFKVLNIISLYKYYLIKKGCNSFLTCTSEIVYDFCFMMFFYTISSFFFEVKEFI